MEIYIVHPTKEQEEIVLDFFKSLNIPYEKRKDVLLPNHVLDGIKRGQEDIEAGRFVSFESFKNKLSF